MFQSHQNPSVTLLILKFKSIITTIIGVKGLILTIAYKTQFVIYNIQNILFKNNYLQLCLGKLDINRLLGC